MKIYDEYYRVIELSQTEFDLVEEHLNGSTGCGENIIKYLLGNDEERNYLSEMLDLEKVELGDPDYFKIVLVNLIGD
jgi:hypothetical protein